MTDSDVNVDPEVLIDWFDDFSGPNQYGFLSNFAREHQATVLTQQYVNLMAPRVLVSLMEAMVERPLGFVYEVPTPWTGEHLFQAAKATTYDDWFWVLSATSPSQAKSHGRSVALRNDWEGVKLDVMREVIRLKFLPGTLRAEQLVATGTAYLREGTYWGDEIWGVNLNNPIRPGQNWLGTILMERRAALVLLGHG